MTERHIHERDVQAFVRANGLRDRFAILHYGRLSGRDAAARKHLVRPGLVLGELAQLSTALDTFRLDMGRYPSTQEGLAALLQPPSGASRWDGPYLSKSVMPLDPWDNPYQYRSPGGGGRPYDLFSFGADGAPGGEGDGRDISNWEG